MLSGLINAFYFPNETIKDITVKMIKNYMIWDEDRIVFVLKFKIKVVYKTKNIDKYLYG